MQEGFKHHKAILAVGAGVELLRRAALGSTELADGENVVDYRGVVTTTAGDGAAIVAAAARFVNAVTAHRHWDRDTAAVPA